MGSAGSEGREGAACFGGGDLTGGKWKIKDKSDPFGRIMYFLEIYLEIF